VARTSRRNFLTLFRAVRVDADAKGPEVSDDVQLVYIADDLRQTNYIYGGGGTTEAAVVGEHGYISLTCQNAGGLELQQITMNILVPGDGVTLRVWTSSALPVVTGVANILSTLRTTGLQGLPGAPLGLIRAATIATAAIPVAAFRYVDTAGFTPPFYINNGQILNVAFGTANVFVDLGIRWRELRLFPG